MTAKITAYIDCVSPYSYLALLYLEKNRNALSSHDVAIDHVTAASRSFMLGQLSNKASIVPVFLGGINVGSGNKPPWTLPAKAAYSKYDSARAKHYHGVPNLTTPSFFPILSLFPQRALTYIKSAYPDVFVQTFIDICSAMWEEGKDVSKPEILAEVLGKRVKEQEVQDIITKANSPEYKQALNDTTKEALERGAFGCPWFWVRNSKGDEEPFFGSDRFHFMWQYLGLPWQDIELHPATEKAKI